MEEVTEALCEKTNLGSQLKLLKDMNAVNYRQVHKLEKEANDKVYIQKSLGNFEKIYVQKYGIDFSKILSTIAIRALFELVGVKSAFLHENLDEEIYKESRRR